MDVQPSHITDIDMKAASLLPVEDAAALVPIESTATVLGEKNDTC
jgi:hypothetical protein